MSRRITAIAVLAGALCALSLAAGCAHPCGYVDLRTQVVWLEGDRVTEVVPAPRPLTVEKDLSVANSVLEVKAEQLEVTYAPARLELYGKRVWVPGFEHRRWYLPFLKPVIAATIIAPLYLSWADPHAHGARNWNGFDYLRDVFAWFNVFSAIPTAPRQVALEDSLVRSRVEMAAVAERRVVDPGRVVVLHLDDIMIEQKTADSAGMLSFDLAPLIKPETASQDHKAYLIAPAMAGRPAAVTVAPVSAHLAQEWLKARASAPTPPR